MESKSMIHSQNISSVEVSECDLLEEFLRKCKDAEPSDEMDRAIQKIRKRITEVDPKYKKSNSFLNLLETSISKVVTERWYAMKELCDTLKHHSKKKTLKKKGVNSTETVDSMVAVRENEKTEKQIEKLEKTLDNLASEIQTLEQSEVDFAEGDDEDSNYIKLDRYKKRFCNVYKKINELKEVAGDVPRKSIYFSGTKLFSINRAVEKYYNERKEFPEFCDILNVVQTENEKKKLGLSPTEIHETAEVAFDELGQLLKLQRKYELHDTMNSYLSAEMADDPATVDDELERKLSENEIKHGYKIDQLINEFVKRQDVERPECVELSSDDEISIINNDGKISKTVSSVDKMINDCFSDDDVVYVLD